MRRIDKPLSYWQDIYNIYVTDNLSYEALSVKVGESVSTIRRRFKELDFGAKDKTLIEQSRRTTCAKVFSDPDRLAEINKKKHATCIEKYGTTHPTKSEMVKNKTANTNFRKYGHGSALQNEQVKEKIRQTNLKVYGVENPSQCKEVREKVATSHKIRYDKAFNDLLDSKSISCDTEFRGYRQKLGDKSVDIKYEFQCHECDTYFDARFSKDLKCPACSKVGSNGQSSLSEYISKICADIKYQDRSLISPQELDIYIPKKSMAFGYNGSYWHRRSCVGITYHRDKTEKCLSKGTRLYHIWEHEDEEKVKAIVAHLLGVTQLTYGARQLTHSMVPTQERVEFFNSNHLHNDTQAAFALGLINDQNQIIQAISFRKNKEDLEIARFATKLNCNVQGGFSKLMKHSLNYIKQNYPDVNKIITYCDRDWTPDYKDSVYFKYGFKSMGDSGPMLKYYSKGQVHSRHKFQKHKLKDMFEDFKDRYIVNDFLETKQIYAFYNSGNWKFELNI